MCLIQEVRPFLHCCVVHAKSVVQTVTRFKRTTQEDCSNNVKTVCGCWWSMGVRFSDYNMVCVQSKPVTLWLSFQKWASELLEDDGIVG